jgi:hypothetical protein
VALQSVRLSPVRKGYAVPIGIAASIAAGAGALLLFLFIMQERMAFHPSREIEATPASLGLPFREVRAATDDGGEISGWWLPAGEGAPSILFLHGNAGNISHRLGQIRELHEAGFAILIIDYRGYGRSPGTPSEARMALDARAGWDLLTGDLGVEGSSAILYGESIGSAPALRLALALQEGDGPAGLVLEGAFTSALEMARRAFPFLPVRWILRLRMDNIGAVKALKLPALFIHGSRDEVVPLSMGRELAEASTHAGSRFVEVPGAMHNTLWLTAPSRLAAEITVFAHEIRAAPPPEEGGPSDGGAFTEP